jgi:hypothetical protein
MSREYRRDISLDRTLGEADYNPAPTCMDVNCPYKRELTLKEPGFVERIARWELVTTRLVGFIAFLSILLIGLGYTLIEGIKFLIQRFLG